VTYHLTGHLRKDPATGEVVGEIHDVFGLSIVLTCTRSADGYTVIAVPGPIPDDLAIPFLDDQA
jgi:hypothetical protein